MKLGMVGTDILHATLYAGVLNARPGPQAALPQDEHDLEIAFGGEATEQLADAGDRRTTADEIRSDPAFADFSVVAWWSPDQEAAKRQAARAHVPQVTTDLDELVELVDAGLVCTWEGSTHAELALPFLRAGKPVYIDKPLCEDVEEAELLVRTARENGTFFFSSSPWKWSPAVARLVDALPRVGELRTVMVTGPAWGGSYFYVIHEVELMQHIVGSEVVSVRCTSNATHHLAVLEFADGTVGVLNGLRETRWFRHAVVYGQDGVQQASVTNLQRDEGMVRMLREFCLAVRRDSPPLPMELSEEAVRILVSADQSARNSGATLSLKTG